MATLPNPRYNFDQITIADLITRSYNDIGISGAAIQDQEITTALYFLNEIQSEWINRQIIQFNEERYFFPLQNNVAGYQVPAEIYDTYVSKLASVTRQVGGTPYSSAGGVPANCFKYDPTLSCLQTSANGIIGLEFPIPTDTSDPLPRIDFVGVQLGQKAGDPNFSASYTLTISGSNDNFIWTPLYVDTREQKWDRAGEIKWYTLPSAMPFRYMQIQETGGNILNISGIFFNVLTNSKEIKMIGRSEFLKQSNQNSQGMPSQVSMEKQGKNIFMRFFPVPDSIPLDYNENSEEITNQPYNFFYALGAVLPFSFNYLKANIDTNYRFLPALRKALTAELANSYLPDSSEAKKQSLKLDAERSLIFALNNDNDGGKLRFQIRRL